MKAWLVAAVAGVFLVACQPDGGGRDSAVPESVADGAGSTEDAGQEAFDAPPLEVPVGSLEIGGVVIAPGFAFTQRYDRVRETQVSKQDQRQILLEAEVAYPVEALAQITVALERAGFTANEPQEQYGGQRVKFERRGERDVFALVRDRENGPSIQSETAGATVYLTQML